MPSEQQLADYLASALPDRERAEFEAELAAHPEALRELVEQRRLDAALGALLDPKSEPLEAAIMASVRGATDEAIEARVLEATVFAKPVPSLRTAWLAMLNWPSGKTSWRWAGVAVVLVLLVLGTMSYWSAKRSGQHRQPGLELAGADRESELVRELAPLVIEPPVWTGAEQQSAWLTALAAATASGGNER